MATLPYVTAPGNIEKALSGIKTAAVPEKVSQDFVKTILGVKGGSGNQMTSFLKKIGFVNTDGSPSEIYKRFRNPTSTGSAAAEALKLGFAPLYVRNEYMHKLGDDALRGLVLEETGQGNDSSAIQLVLAAIKYIKKFADFSTPTAQTQDTQTQSLTPSSFVSSGESPDPSRLTSGAVGLNLGYTINLNLPSTSDIAVFNAIFKSLRENLLTNELN